MPDLRLLAPAGSAWLVAWLAVAAPDAGLARWTAAAICWAAAVVALGTLGVSVRFGSVVPRSPRATAGADRGRAARGGYAQPHARLTRVAATALTALAAGGLLATAGAG